MMEGNKMGNDKYIPKAVFASPSNTQIMLADVHSSQGSAQLRLANADMIPRKMFQAIGNVQLRYSTSCVSVLPLLRSSFHCL